MRKRTILVGLTTKNPSLQFLNFSSSPSAHTSRAPGDLSSCIACLQACAHHRNLTKGQELHSWMLVNGFLGSPSSITSLINMYSKCEHMTDAVSVFDLSVAHDRNVYAWNAIIAGFIANGHSKLGFEYYSRMRHMSVVPDKFTYPCAIRACCDVSEASDIKKIHGELFKYGLELDPFIGSALVSSYLKFGLVDHAHILFEELPMRDVVLYNAMINGYAQIGKLHMALEVFAKMGEKGLVPSKFTVTGVFSVLAMMGDLKNGRSIHGFVIKLRYDSGLAVSNSLIDMYGKCKCIADAQLIFDMIVEKDIFSWNSIISVHERFGNHDVTLELFNQMLGARIQPDLVTLTTVLPACAHLAASRHGREIHGYMIVNGLGKHGDNEVIDYMFVNNAIMDMYAKCGCMKDAHLIFNQMTHKDLASWNIMIMGYGMHGDGNKTLDMFSTMCSKHLNPDEVTFVGLLSACSHSGFMAQGHEFLTQMESKFGVVPTIEHYTCVIDMLGRAGQLDKAHELISTMPVECNPVVWRAFLASCQLHKNASLAEVAAQKAFELEPGHCGSYVLMSNVYGQSGQYGEVMEVRDAMRQQNVRKNPGCSWIELRNGVHVFGTADRSHPQSCSIYSGLNSLTARLHEHGYVPGL